MKFGKDLNAAVRYVAANAIKARCFDDSDTFMLIDGILFVGDT